MYSPEVAAMPALRALATPALALRITRTLESKRACRSAIAAVLSIDPSSTTTTSRLGYVCERTLLRVSSNVCAALWAGIMTDTKGDETDDMRRTLSAFDIS